MIRMMHREQAKGFTDLGLLFSVQAILFRKLRGAFWRRTSFCRSCTPLWWLQNISANSHPISNVLPGLPWWSFVDNVGPHMQPRDGVRDQ
jgi:hypothetical protein